MKWLENLTGGYSSSAKVVNDTLVLSLPDAKSPIVWRMELADIKAAAFEVQEKESDFILVMKKPKGDVQDIAPFDSRAKALKALMSASQAMEHAQNISAANDGGNRNAAVVAPPRKSRFGQAVTGLIGIVILLGLLFTLTQVGPKNPQFPGSGISGAAQSESGARTGVPQSADDFLMQK